MRRKALLCAVLCVCVAASGCTSLGANRLKADQVDYARALGEAKKREILAAIVGIRFADSPAFLSVSQIIAAYTFDATAGSTLSAGDTTQNFAAAHGPGVRRGLHSPACAGARAAAGRKRDSYRPAVAHHGPVDRRPAERKRTGWPERERQCWILRTDPGVAAASTCWPAQRRVAR